MPTKLIMLIRIARMITMRGKEGSNDKDEKG